MEKKLNVKRLDVTFVETKLNILLGLSKNDTTNTAFLTMLTLTKTSDKYNLPVNAPFPAIVKSANNGNLAVYCCTTGKHEIIPEGSYKEPTPVGKSFEYKGHVYERNPVHYIYSLKK